VATIHAGGVIRFKPTGSSIPPEPARRFDPLKLREIKVADRSQRVRRRALGKARRQAVEPCLRDSDILTRLAVAEAELRHLSERLEEARTTIAKEEARASEGTSV
jgi:hypothetical protein